MDLLDLAKLKPGTLCVLKASVLADRCCLHPNGEIGILTTPGELPKASGVFLLLKATIHDGHVSIVGLWGEEVLYILLAKWDLDTLSLCKD